MEANSLDLSTLKISSDSEDNLDLKPDAANTEMSSKCEEKGIFENRPPDSELNKIELPINVDTSDDEEETVILSVDEYFRALDILWNQPEYATDADFITMENRMPDAAPYNLFFTTLKHCPETMGQLYSISFTDLLCSSLGKLKSSIHFTFMADITWILTQFALKKLHKLPMTIIHGYDKIPWPEEETIEELYPNIDYHYIDVRQKETDLGCHHSKLSIFLYEDDSLRVVIGSANLYAQDWKIYNQQIWISPSCPKLPTGSSVMNGESPTGFKFSLIDYLLTYKKYNIPSVQEWIERIEKADFSDVKVALLFTMPGVHYPRKNGSLLHFLGHLLTRDCIIPAPKKEHDSWRIVAQTASLGLVGRRPEEWLTTFLLKALGSHKDLPYFPTLHSISRAKFSLIFPTVQNVLGGYLGPRGANCCSYDINVKAKQPWLLKTKCQWKAHETKRSRAMSHSKIYCRISPCWEKMAYYFLTSANLSRSAWGKVPDQESGIYVRSNEIGILFLPKYFNEEYFEVKDTPNRKNKKIFPMMFDLPLTPYGPNDDSFCKEEIEQDDTSSGAENNSWGASIFNSCRVPSADTSQRQYITINKWDKNTVKSAQVTEKTKKDMKFNVSPNADMFFPSFNKKH